LTCDWVQFSIDLIEIEWTWHPLSKSLRTGRFLPHRTIRHEIFGVQNLCQTGRSHFTWVSPWESERPPFLSRLAPFLSRRSTPLSFRHPFRTFAASYNRSRSPIAPQSVSRWTPSRQVSEDRPTSDEHAAAQILALPRAAKWISSNHSPSTRVRSEIKCTGRRGRVGTRAPHAATSTRVPDDWRSVYLEDVNTEAHRLHQESPDVIIEDEEKSTRSARGEIEGLNRRL
jgi:hypothetical protein